MITRAFTIAHCAESIPSSSPIHVSGTFVTMMLKLVLVLLAVSASQAWYHRGGHHRFHGHPHPFHHGGDMNGGGVDTRVQQCPEVAQACTGVNDNVGDRIAGQTAANDDNGDGTITNFEQIKDIVNSDPNNDGCLTQEEWIQVRNQNQGLSEEFLRFFLEFINAQTTANCAGFDVAALVTPTSFPADGMNNVQLQALAAFCEADQNLYTSNCDCAQLPAACQDDRFSGLDACVNYNTTIADRDGCVFNPQDPADNDDQPQNPLDALLRTVCGNPQGINDPFVARLCAQRG